MLDNLSWQIENIYLITTQPCVAQIFIYFFFWGIKAKYFDTPNAVSLIRMILVVLEIFLIFVKPRGERALNNVLHGDAPLHGPNPYPLIYRFFDRKGHPFIYLPYKMAPLPYTYRRNTASLHYTKPYATISTEKHQSLPLLMLAKHSLFTSVWTLKYIKRRISHHVRLFEIFW